MGSILSLRHYSHDQIVHSHDHAHWSWASAAASTSRSRRGSRVLRQTFAVVPAQARHACSSPSGSRCLVLDLPCDGSLLLGLGEHAEAGRRLFERPQALSLTPAQGQLVNWLASGPINDPVIAHQGAGCSSPAWPASASRRASSPACHWPASTPTSTAMPPIRYR